MMSDRRPSRSPDALLSIVPDDGSLVETVLSEETGKTSFLQWHAGAAYERATLTLPSVGRVIPYGGSNNLLRHGVLLLPSRAEEYGTVEALLGAVRSYIRRYADLSSAFEELASHYVLLTWVYDAFSEVPYLRLKGDYGTGKTRCLQTIGSVCYKPMFASGASTASPLFRMLDSVQGTLVIDESDFRFSDERAEITKILNSGNARGFPVLRSEVTPQKEFNPTAFAVFGPKIVATRGSFDDRALESRCITESMSGAPPREEIPLNLPPEFHSEARALRNRLLMYRFRTRNAIRPAPLGRALGVEPRVAQVFAPLLAVAADEEARQRMLAAAQTKTGELAAERGASVEAQLLAIINEMKRDELPLQVKEISRRFEERFGHDHRTSITPRWVGRQLRSRLSLFPVKSHGNFTVPSSDDRRLDSLFKRYGVGD
jgi:hypothetical protein